MTMAADTPPGAPIAPEVRAQVERMALSEAFRTSPQLVSFLRFVVEAVLSGNALRLKGYTIGVEALGRDATFDPQIDPIVRVEAGRLRRTIDRYYRGIGSDDEIIIDLPRGGYAPIFSRRTVGTAVTASPSVAASAPVGPTPSPIPGSSPGPNQGTWRPARWGAVALVVVAVIAAAVLVPRLREASAPSVASGAAPVRPAMVALPGNGMPVLTVEPFAVTGTPRPDSVMATSLREHLGDAFARFDLVNVVPDGRERVAAVRSTPAARDVDYRFAASIEYDAAGAARIGLRVIDARTGDVIWSQTIEHVAAAPDPAAAEEAIVRQVAPVLLQPFGVIYADGRRRILATGTGDPRYRCIIDTAESFRSFDPVQHQRARACLEQLTASDPSFAVGFSYLAAVYLREYQYGIGTASDGTALLERALRAARRGVELAPASSRAYEMLFVVLFARHELPAAFAAGDRAMALNRYDARSRGAYGARLVASGDIDKGLALLERAAADGSIVPAFEQFFLFLGHYLHGDLARASFDAGQLTSNDFQLGLIARALMAQAKGDHGGARRATDRLVALNHAWRDDLHRSLSRFFVDAAVIDRLTRDLGNAGISGS